jgi:hypothetical protein
MIHSYYRVQQYKPSDESSLDFEWRNVTWRIKALQEASYELRETWLSASEYSTRLVRSFFDDRLDKEVVFEILKYFEAKQ